MQKQLEKLFINKNQINFIPHIKLLREFLFFLDKIQNLYKKFEKSKSKFDLIYLKLYVYIKYTMIRYKMLNIIKNDSIILLNKPERFLNTITSYFLFVLFYADIMNYKSVNKLIQALNIPDDQISIITDLDYIEDDKLRKEKTINKYKIIYRNNTSYKEFKNKFSITTASINLNYNTIELEQTIYNCDNYFDTKTANILYTKYFKIDSDGKLSNPNYVFDNALEKEEMQEYRNIIIVILELFVKVAIQCIQISTVKEKVKNNY